MAIENITDKRGREWECFIDRAYFEMVCVRPVGDRDFNSQLSFHFTTMEKSKQFMSLLEEAS